MPSIRSVRSFLLLFIGILAATAPITAQTMSGHTAGQFQVNESGAATYTIPITVPPGTAGMEPKLALSYSSQGRNSLLGMGWSLSGLSAISRCPVTLAQDGVIDPVDFDEDDRFCLDGERLMAVAGVYGEDATEYRTEQNTFRRTISYGEAGSGPASFTIWTKAGLIMEYGGTEDSRIEAQDRSDALFWAVSRISDTKGNYLTVTYAEDNTNGEYRPTRIDYTGNDGAALAPYVSVQLSYEDRPDITPRYVGGSLLRTTQRLTALSAFEGEQLYREYRLAYETSETTGRSRLASITECGSDETCFAPTDLTWQNGGDGTFGTFIDSSFGSSGWTTHARLGDFNGDGQTDFIYTGSTRLRVRLSDGDGTFGPIITTEHGSGGWNTSANLGDFDGDGQTDFIYTGSTRLRVRLSNGDGTFGPIITTEHGSSGWHSHATLADVNGDGRTDFIYTGSSILYVRLSNGDGTFGQFIESPFGSSGWDNQAKLGDFNLDGKADFIYTGSNTLYVRLSEGNGTFGPLIESPFGSSGWTTHARLGDFNGDGQTDFIYTGSTRLRVRLSKGDGTFGPIITTEHGSSGWDTSANLGDFNDDGQTDFIYTGSTRLRVRLSHGDGTFGPIITTEHGSSGWHSYANLGDFDGNGQTDFIYTGSDSLHVRLQAVEGAADLLSTVVTGHGFQNTIAYAPLTDSSVYTKDAEAEYPEQDFQGPMHVVSSYAVSNGIDGQSSFSYHYGGAKVDLHGRGFRGFDRTTVTDNQTGTITAVYFDRRYFCISSKIRRTEQRQPDGTLISEVDNTLVIQDHGFGVHFSYVGESVARNYELDGSLVSTVTTATDYDDYGNVLSLTVEYGDGHTETTVNTYDNDFSNWFLGRLTRAEVTKTAPGQPDQTRTSEFTYDPDSGLLTSEIIEPDDPALRLEKTYLHGPFANITTSTTSGADISSRAHTTTYDAEGRYVLQSTNALGHTETKAYALSNLASLTGPNLLTTSWSYDGFGRQVSELRADGTETVTSYELCEESCPDPAIYFVRSDTTGAPTSITYFDVLDREIRRETQGFDGTPIYVDTEYNALGQVAQISEPYFAAETPHWTTFTYDLVGRVLTETAPGNRVTTTAYAGLTTTITNPLDQQNIRTVDARGQLVASTDDEDKTVTHSYDAFGNMVEMTDPLDNATTLTYDIRGNKTSITDPDTGTTTFVYNTLGELTSQTDANNNTVTLAYDALGRIISRSEPEGTSTWVYDTHDTGIGKLAVVSRGDYTEEYFYDALGRPEETTITISGDSYLLTTGYDLFGRPETATYPSGFGVRTLYNIQGYVQELRRLSDDQTLWQADTINARGQLEQATLGNGLVTSKTFEPETGRVEQIQTSAVQDLAFSWDALGNLTSRSDQLRGLSESFTYDSLNRLTSSQVAGQGAVNVIYDALGNIMSKSGVGTYTYGENGAGPHAVTSIDGTEDLAFTYDANGNLTLKAPIIPEGLIFADGFESGDVSVWEEGMADPAAPTSVAYTSFNKPDSITKGSTSLTFDYGPEYARYRQTATSGGPVTTTLYIGGLFERKTIGSITRDLHYIRAGGQVVAVYSVEDTGAGSLETIRYLHRDHLGSVQTITDEVGVVVEVLSFDPWGLRRNAEDWLPATTPIIPTLDRGFTGHEHLDEVTLIHMNGRVYDPVIGRFLSADPFIQIPEFTQSLNRYSYVLNNPLSLTDPSGFLFKSLFRGIRHAISRTVSFIEDNGYTIARLAAAALPPPYNIAATIAADFAISFHAGIQSGAGFSDAFRAGLSSALISGVESFALLQIAQASPAPTPEVLREHWEKKSSTLSYVIDRFKSQVPKALARGVVKGTTGTLRGGDPLKSFGLSLAIDTLSIGRDLTVEVDVMENVDALIHLEKCENTADCLEKFRLTFSPGKQSLIGKERKDPKAPLSDADKIFSEQGTLRHLNYFPGANSAAAFHDSFVRLVGVDNLATNQATIVQFFAINYLSLGIGFSEESEGVNLIPINSR